MPYTYAIPQSLPINKSLPINQCVSGETELLTPNGFVKIKDVIDQEVIIWNGNKWSTVTPKITGHNKRLYRVLLDNGLYLDCTKTHIWHTQTIQNRVSKLTTDLLQSDISLIPFKYPVIRRGKVYTNMYTQGFYSGHPFIKSAYIKLTDNKMMCLPLLNCTGLLGHVLKHVKKLHLNVEFNDVNWVPLDGNLKSKMEWLSGFFDRASCDGRAGHIYSWSMDVEILRNIQKLLMTIGVMSYILDSDIHKYWSYINPPLELRPEINVVCFSLAIPSNYVQDLLKLGLKLSSFETKKYKGNMLYDHLNITKVFRAEKAENVYCLTEPKQHSVCFNGILTGNCD